MPDCQYLDTWHFVFLTGSLACQYYYFLITFVFFSTLDLGMLRMTRARRSQVEQQHLISVEKAMEILSEQTPQLIVDYEKLNVCNFLLYTE